MSERKSNLTLLPHDAGTSDREPAGNGTGERPAVLLRTKITRPRSADPATLLGRDRLDARMRDGFDCRLTLICAPAGFGKTTLVSQTLARLPAHWPVAWYSIDRQDNDAARFLAYLCGSLRLALTGDPDDPGGFDGSPQAGVLLDRTLNALAADQRPLTLVIDDLHRIDNPAPLSYLAYLIDFMPSSMRLIIMSRREPELPLSRYRAYGDLLELRAEDLCFTRDETTCFLQLGAAKALDEELVEQVQERTEGWVFALQTLKALINHEVHARRAEVVRRFVGSQRHVAEFLFDEVLLKHSPDQRAFLLQTAILSRLNGRLCDRLLGRDDGEEMLHELERTGIPMFALDDQGHWYRYHHLFAEMLVEQLRREQGDAFVAELHRKACAVFRADELPEEAIEHALAARDWERAVELLHEIGYDPVGQRRVATFRRWIETLPPEYLTGSAQISYWYGRSLYTMSAPHAARTHLERAERLWIAEGVSDRVGDVRESRAWCAILAGDHAGSVQLAAEAFALNRPRGQRAVDGSTYTMAVALSRVGRARDALAQLESLGPDHELSDLAAIEHGHILLLLGRLHEARAKLLAGLAADNPMKQLLRAHVWLATIAHAWNDLDAVAGYLDRANMLAGVLENRPFYPSLEVARARLQWALGQTVDALATLDAGIARARAAEFGPAIRQAQAVRAGYWLELGRLDEAAAFQAALPAAVERIDGESIDTLLVRARLAQARGEHEAAIASLAREADRADASGCGRDAARLLVQREIAEQAAGVANPGHPHLRAAIRLLEPGGDVRTLIDDGASAALSGPLRAIAASGDHLEFIGQVLAAVGEAERVQRHPSTGPLDALSPRELEVLRLVAIGLANREIADQLFISVATVKRHLSTVFEKLEVANRTQAVALARDHGLL